MARTAHPRLNVQGVKAPLSTRLINLDYQNDLDLFCHMDYLGSRFENIRIHLVIHLLSYVKFGYWRSIFHVKTQFFFHPGQFSPPSPTPLTWIWVTGAAAGFPRDDDMLFPILQGIVQGSQFTKRERYHSAEMHLRTTEYASIYPNFNLLSVRHINLVVY